MKVEAYRNLTKGCWSVRRGGRVIAHESRVVLRSCTMRVREGGRQRAIREGQRNVHAWIEGEPCDGVDAELVEIGYNPFMAAAFTVRPGFVPVHVADLVLLEADGRAWAAL